MHNAACLQAHWALGLCLELMTWPAMRWPGSCEQFPALPGGSAAYLQSTCWPCRCVVRGDHWNSMVQQIRWRLVTVMPSSCLPIWDAWIGAASGCEQGKESEGVQAACMTSFP